jgi:hypothetical protein
MMPRLETELSLLQGTYPVYAAGEEDVLIVRKFNASWIDTIKKRRILWLR